MRTPLACILLIVSCGASAAAQERFSVVGNGEVVGSLVATIEGDPAAAADVNIDYRVSNNGRGPKLHERIKIGAGSVPTEWVVDGSSLMGGAVKERFSSNGKRLHWESQADKGDLQSGEPHLYAINDGSPWAYGIYARALLRASGQSLPAAPSGTMRLEKLEDTTVGEGAQAKAIGVYAITGIGLLPEYVLLDSDRRLFAQMQSGIEGLLIREGYEKEEKKLKDLAQSMDFLQLERLQARFAHRYDRPVRIRNVRVFDPKSERVSGPKSVVIFRNRIASVDEESATSAAAAASSTADAAAANTRTSDEVVVDGAGGTLMSGLHDMHSHNAPWSGLFRIAAGVTSVRDMGNDNAALLDLTQRIDSGKLPGPRIVRAGFIEGRSPYSARLGVIPATLPDGIKAVQWYADHGYWQIKIYNSLNPDWVKPLAAEAHRLGLHVSGHVPAFMSPDRAIRDGYDEITHINQLMLGWLIKPGEDTRTPLRLTAMGERAWSLDLDSPPVRATIDLMKEHHTALDTTAVILERLMLSRAGKVQPGDAPYLGHTPIGYQRYRRRSFVNFKTPQDDEHYVQSVRKIIDTMSLLHREGIRLLPGTDDETGFTLHRELELYVAAGIPAAEVLRMATLDCDAYLGRAENFGSIEVGKFADLMLVAGDPTQDISAVRKISMVTKDGALYFPSELYGAVGIRPFAAPPQVSAPANAEISAVAAKGAAPLTADMTTTEPIIGAVSSRHRIRIGKESIAYTATFEETPLGGAAAPEASISSTSYVRDGVRDRATRPVVFAFNGGPGASSSPLHFSAFGPRRFDGKGDALLDNAETLLDAAELVFIDPVGTGFSRVRSGADPAEYWSVEGDAKATLDLIRKWLHVHGRESSPVYIAGESYGGYRLATLAANASDVNIAGLIFLSPMLDASGSTESIGNDQPYVFALPTMAAAAWQHEKIDRHGTTVEQFFEDARVFAESDYMMALRRGSALSDAERTSIAARMAQFIGLPADKIAAANLRVDSETFLQTLLPDRIVGRLDVRVTGPKPADRPKDRPPAADDPALGLHGSNVIKSARVRDYMTRELQVPTARDYLALTLDVNFRWNWSDRSDSPQFYINPTPNVATLLTKRPESRVLLLGGLFDLAVPAGGPRYALQHAGLPADRVIMKTFVAGHSPFDSDESRAQVSAVVHQFLRGETGEAPRPTIVTRHSGTFNGKRLSYTASVESFDVPDAKGRPAARLVSFGYEAEKVGDLAKRPVLFAFNGGPIVASQWLHIGMLGPKRIEVPEDPKAGATGARLVDNPYSPLDVADVVMIDPASTGFSRVLPGTSPESYFSVTADGQQVAAFIAAWLERHDRMSSPVYIFGESYGTMRAVEVAGQLAETPKPILADGVVLFGQAINIIEYAQRPQNIVSYVVSLPTLAAIAWYHGKVDRNGRTLPQFVADADRYAQTEYLTALIQGNAIDPAERDRVAQKLESLSGIPAAYYRDHGLRISKEQFRGELLKDKQLLLGRTDGRYVAEMTDKGIGPDPFEVVMQPFNTLFGDYLRKELKVSWPDPYVQDSPVKDLDGWDWGDRTPFSRFAYGDRLNKVMASNPRFQVLVGNGYFDTQTTVGAANLAVRQSGWPAGRARLEYYEGGHMAYSNPAAAKKLAADLRAFMTR